MAVSLLHTEFDVLRLRITDAVRQRDGSIQRAPLDCCAGILQTGEPRSGDMPITAVASPALPRKRVALLRPWDGLTASGVVYSDDWRSVSHGQIHRQRRFRYRL
jgi:hypothetical protein